MAIRINELLALRSELTRAMFSMVVAGRRNLMFFPAKKAVDECWEVVLIICQGISGHCPPFFHLSPFYCLCVPPFLVPLSVFLARKFRFHESLFLDKNLNQSCFLDKIFNQIDSLILYLIIFILWVGGSGSG